MFRRFPVSILEHLLRSQKRLRFFDETSSRIECIDVFIEEACNFCVIELVTEFTRKKVAEFKLKRREPQNLRPREE